MEEVFDIGKRGIVVDFGGEPLELVYTIGALRAMEDLAQRWAKKAEVQIPGGLFSSAMIMNNLGNENLLIIALWGALRKEKPKMRIEEVDALYETYLEKEGDRADLVGILVEAYARARNPRRYQSAKEMAQIQEEAKEKAGAGTEPPNEA